MSARYLLTMAVWVKYLTKPARAFTSLWPRIKLVIHVAITFAILITIPTFGARTALLSSAQALLRHSLILIAWKWWNSMMVN